MKLAALWSRLIGRSPRPFCTMIGSGLCVAIALGLVLRGLFGGRIGRSTDRLRSLQWATEREKDRYGILLRRSEILDSRAGTLLSALVVVGGVLGAFWAFSLDKDSASTVERLADDPGILSSLLAALILYAVAAVALAASLLISIRISSGIDPSSPLPNKERLAKEAWEDFHRLSTKMVCYNNWKWRLLIAFVTLFSLSLAAVGVCVVRVFLEIGPIE